MKVAHWMNLIPAIAAIAVGVILPPRTMVADTGPKPSMSFRFVFEITPAPTILSGVQLECDDPECITSEPLAQMGPQLFYCHAQECSSMAYGYSDYHKLRVDFSDGKTRESNVFGKKYFSAVYQVTVRANDLVVKEQRGEGMPLFFFLLGSGPLFFVVPIMFILLVIFLVIVAIRTAEFNQARGIYITAWIISLLLSALNLLNPGMFSSLIFTLIVEMAIALVYGLWRKRPLILVLTVIWMINLVTHMVLGLFFEIFSYSSSGGMVLTLVAEGVIWLVEAGILAMALRKQVKFWEALALSAVLNLTSFGLGLLLPF